MSVLLETSLGDLVIDLDVDNCPKACENFLKLAKTYYYTYNVFFSVQKGFLAQVGDPTATGSGGQCVWSRLPPSSKDASRSKFFTPERMPSLKHKAKGTVSMALTALTKDEDEERVAGSQFFVTLDENLDYLDSKHAPFGTVVEGHELGGTLDKINDAFTDDTGRPLQDIRIRHVEILDDPFPDPAGLEIPSRPPSPVMAAAGGTRLADDEQIKDTRTEEEKEKARREADTNAAALTLEMVGDLPFAEVRPPENILFVCKLNPVTRSDDLKLLFGRFGDILSCEVIRDKKTGDSLQYAFIEFDKQEAAEMAYFKMQNVLVDDRRIWVDFSQSVSNLHKSWMEKRLIGTRGLRDRSQHSYSGQHRPAQRRAKDYDYHPGGSSRPGGARDGAYDRRGRRSCSPAQSAVHGEPYRSADRGHGGRPWDDERDGTGGYKRSSSRRDDHQTGQWDRYGFAGRGGGGAYERDHGRQGR